MRLDTQNRRHHRGLMLDLQLARLGAFMREFWPFRWACVAPVLVQRPNFSMQGEFCHYGRETTPRDTGITGRIDETRSAQVGSFLHKFSAHRWDVLGRSAPIFKEWITAGKIWPLWMRDNTHRQRHHRCNATATVGASGPVYVWILVAHGDLRGVIFRGLGAAFPATPCHVWCGDPVKLTPYPPFIINN